MVEQMLSAYGSISLASGLFVIFESNRSKIKLMESAKINLPGAAARNENKKEMKRISADASDITYCVGAALTLLGIVMNFFAA